MVLAGDIGQMARRMGRILLSGKLDRNIDVTTEANHKKPE